MNKTSVSFDASHFLLTMRHRSFAFVGAAMLLRAHLTMAPANRLSRAAVYEVFRVTTDRTRCLVDDVVDFAFREDDQKMIYSPGVDRAVSDSA